MGVPWRGGHSKMAVLDMCSLHVGVENLIVLVFHPSTLYVLHP